MRIVGIEDQGDWESNPNYLEIPDYLDLTKENILWKEAGQPSGFVDWLLARGAKLANLDHYTYSANPQPVDPETKLQAELWAKEACVDAMKPLIWKTLMAKECEDMSFVAAPGPIEFSDEVGLIKIVSKL